MLAKEPLTSREVAARLGHPLGIVRSTLCYAVQQGDLKIADTVVDPITKRSSYRYLAVPTKPNESFSDAVRKLVAEHPGLSAAEIAEELKGRPKAKAKSIVTGTIHRLHKVKRQLRIVGYRLNTQTHRQVALYGPAEPGKKDAQRPKSTYTNADHCARYVARKKARSASVFDFMKRSVSAGAAQGSP
jgi:hypothetical protein